MATNVIRFKVDGGPTLTAATTQINLGTFDITAIPGFGTVESGTPRWVGTMRSRVYSLQSGNDHGSKVWELVNGFSHDASAGLLIGTAVAGNAGAGGVILAVGASQTSGTFVWDNSSNTVRFRVTPSAAAATYWMATHDIEIWKES